MKKILLQGSVISVQDLINKRTALCIAVGAAAALLNLLLTLLRTDANHTPLLMANIVTDIAAGWFITWYASFHILPQKRCLRLSLRPTQRFSGEVTAVSGDTARVLGFDCYAVTVGGRKVFLPDCAVIRPEVGSTLTLGIVTNVITEADV